MISLLQGSSGDVKDMILLREDATMSLTSLQGFSQSLGYINARMDGLSAQLIFFHSSYPTLDKNVSNSSNLQNSMIEFVHCNSDPVVKSLFPLPCPFSNSNVFFCCRMSWTLSENGLLL